LCRETNVLAHCLECTVTTRANCSACPRYEDIISSCPEVEKCTPVKCPVERPDEPLADAQALPPPVEPQALPPAEPLEDQNDQESVAQKLGSEL
jgi:hypothetical protein